MILMAMAGGAIFGYWLIGKRNSESSPAIITAIANTQAKMGRSIKRDMKASSVGCVTGGIGKVRNHSHVGLEGSTSSRDASGGVGQNKALAAVEPSPISRMLPTVQGFTSRVAGVIVPDHHTWATPRLSRSTAFWGTRMAFSRTPLQLGVDNIPGSGRDPGWESARSVTDPVL